MSCRKISPLLESFVDGELSPERVLEIEQHLIECAECCERLRFSEAVRASTYRAVRTNADARPTPAFEARVRATLSAERAREELVEEGERERRAPASGGSRLSWRSIAPMAAAAGLVLALGASYGSNDETREQKRAAQAVASAPSDPTATVEALIETLVREHASPAPPAVTDPGPRLIHTLEPEVGVPIRIPKLQQFGARWEGGTVVPVSNQRAASFRYRLGGHRVTVYVYNAERVPIRARLEPRVVRNMPVFVGTHRGYSIAAVERRGVGHAVATDLDDDESAELAVAAVVQ